MSTPWGRATVLEEIRVPQRAGERRFETIVQLLEGTKGGELLRFTYSTGGTVRRGPVTLRGRDLEGVEPDEEVTAPYVKRFHVAMGDDFNTPEALAALFDLGREINRRREAGEPAAALAAVLRNLAAPLVLQHLQLDGGRSGNCRSGRPRGQARRHCCISAEWPWTVRRRGLAAATFGEIGAQFLRTVTVRSALGDGLQLKTFLPQLLFLEAGELHERRPVWEVVDGRLRARAAHDGGVVVAVAFSVEPVAEGNTRMAYASDASGAAHAKGNLELAVQLGMGAFVKRAWDAPKFKARAAVP